MALDHFKKYATCSSRKDHTMSTIHLHQRTTLTPEQDIDVVIIRDGKNLKGWALGLVVGTIGRGVLEKAFRNSVKAIEARNCDYEGSGLNRE